MDKVLLNYAFDEKVASFGAYPRRVNADASDESTLPWGQLSRSIFRGAVVPAAGTRIAFRAEAVLKKSCLWGRSSRGVIHSSVGDVEPPLGMEPAQVPRRVGADRWEWSQYISTGEWELNVMVGWWASS